MEMVDRFHILHCLFGRLKWIIEFHTGVWYNGSTYDLGSYGGGSTPLTPIPLSIHFKLMVLANRFEVKFFV